MIALREERFNSTASKTMCVNSEHLFPSYYVTLDALQGIFRRALDYVENLVTRVGEQGSYLAVVVAFALLAFAMAALCDAVSKIAAQRSTRAEHAAVAAIEHAAAADEAIAHAAEAEAHAGVIDTGLAGEEAADAAAAAAFEAAAAMVAAVEAADQAEAAGVAVAAFEAAAAIVAAAEAANQVEAADAAAVETAAIEAAAAETETEVAAAAAAIATYDTDVSSPSQACTIISSQIAREAMSVMIEQQYLPRELWCVSAAEHSTVKQYIPTKVNISAGMTAATMQSLLSRSTVQHVHFNGRNLSADVLAAVAAGAVGSSGSSSGFTLFGSSVHTVTLENFEQWDTTVVDQLFRRLPATVHTITLALEQPEPDSDEATRPVIGPRGVQTLHVKNLQLCMAALPQTLTALHVEGGYCTVNIPDSCRTVSFKHIAAPGALAPELPHGVMHVDLSESDITALADFPELPDTVTKLQLPSEFTHYIGNLPSQLECLDTGYKYNQRLGALPATLKQLYIKRKADDTQQYEHELGELPYGLEVLHVANMKHSIGMLPDTLQILCCSNHSHELGMLPNSLKVLKISGSNFNHPLGLLPDGLLELDLSATTGFQQPLGALPQSLKTIRLHPNYNDQYDDAEQIPLHNDGDVLAIAAAADIDAVAVMHEPLHSSAVKHCKRAAVAAAVASAAAYSVKLLIISYLLRSI
jgi:hypothetical protein